MPALKLAQLQYEADTWKRVLGFMVEENIHLKNRLSEVLRNGFNKSLLEEVENFQTRFVREDEMIGLLRNEVVELDKLLVKELFEDGNTCREADNRMRKLRGNIKNAENQFGRLKLEFNSYLSENI